MDIAFLYQSQRFLWDIDKSSTNLVKHGISFEEACQVFFDPLLRVEDAATGDEQRDAVIGLTENWALLFVVHMSGEGDAIRIISARQATAQERRAYENYE